MSENILLSELFRLSGFCYVTVVLSGFSIFISNHNFGMHSLHRVRTAFIFAINSSSLHLKQGVFPTVSWEFRLVVPLNPKKLKPRQIEQQRSPEFMELKWDFTMSLKVGQQHMTRDQCQMWSNWKVFENKRFGVWLSVLSGWIQHALRVTEHYFYYSDL